jgi:hypothetical protein
MPGLTRTPAAIWGCLGCRCALLLLGGGGGLLAGCGTTQQNLATQQLLESDAIDAAIAQVDFSPLSGHKVYLDDTYIRDYKGVGFVNSNYVISGLRQQILAAGCYLQDKKEDADYIIEGRLGTLGSDQHDVVYGIPKNNALSGASAVVPGSPQLPAIPELAVAKKVASHGAAKLALFAYDRESRQRVWQSGLSLARSTARDTWILGAGPFQNGTIHRDRVRFAGTRLGAIFHPEDNPRENPRFTAYERPALFPAAPAAAPPPTLLAAPAPAAAGSASSGHAPASGGEAPGLLSADANARPLEPTAPSEIQQVSGESPAPPEPSPPPPASPSEPPPFPNSTP